MKTSDAIRQRMAGADVYGMELHHEEVCGLEREMDGLMASIASSSSVAAASRPLDELGTLQELLATLCFKYRIDLHGRLWHLVKEFDRSDDPDLRKAVFKAIRKALWLT